MQLSDEQIRAIDEGDAVEVRIDTMRCVVVREDVFEELCSRNHFARPSTVVGELVKESMAEYDADDPLLATYQEMR
jgi:hypothetical protein